MCGTEDCLAKDVLGCCGNQSPELDRLCRANAHRSKVATEAELKSISVDGRREEQRHRGAAPQDSWRGRVLADRSEGECRSILKMRNSALYIPDLFSFASIFFHDPDILTYCSVRRRAGGPAGGRRCHRGGMVAKPRRDLSNAGWHSMAHRVADLVIMVPSSGVDGPGSGIGHSPFRVLAAQSKKSRTFRKH